MKTLHFKDKREIKSTRKFNTQVGDLFHSGMAMRDPKTNWREPEHSGEPHKSHAAFSDKKVKHKVAHHQSPNAKIAYDPVDTHTRTLEVGRPARGGRVDMAARPRTPQRPSSSPGNLEQGKTQVYRSQQELALNKRRHMTNLDGAGGAGRSGTTYGHGFGQSAWLAPGGVPVMSGQTRKDMSAAGIQSQGKADIVMLEPTHESVPHKSALEFNLKKAQHLTNMHRTPKENSKFGR